MAMNWTRKELAIIVAGLHENGWSWIRNTTPKAAELSALLRSASIYPDGPADPRFRSASAIQRKGEDLRTARTTYHAKQTRGSGLDRVIIADYEKDPEAVLVEAAAALIELSEGSAAYLPPTEDDELAVAEGHAIMRTHLARERKPGLRLKKIKSVTNAGLPIACEVCGFDYSQFYGSRGEGYIEVHHRRPLHDSGPVNTRLVDLALLCANCHRMIHRQPWMTPDELKAALP